MKKSEIVYRKCLKICENNIKALNVMLSIYDKGREDIVDNLIGLMNYDSQAITPEKLVIAYENNAEDVSKLIALIDRSSKYAKDMRRSWYNEYEKDIDNLQEQFVTGKKEESKREFYTSKYGKYAL